METNYDIDYERYEYEWYNYQGFGCDQLNYKLY